MHVGSTVFEPMIGRRAQARRERVGLVVRIPREHGVLIVEAVVDAHVGRIIVLRALVRIREVVGQPGAGRQRIELHVLDRDRIESTGRNHIARETAYAQRASGRKSGLDSSEKSPVRILSVGTVTTLGTPCVSR